MSCFSVNRDAILTVVIPKVVFSQWNQIEEKHYMVIKQMQIEVCSELPQGACDLW